MSHKSFSLGLLGLIFAFQSWSSPSTQELAAWKRQASKVEILRDHYGVPHIYAKRNADVVFGMLYAQCEDDFARVELNYIEKLGRMAEVFGSKYLAQDAYTRLILDHAAAKADYQQAPAWMKALLQAFADGINFYLATHPEVKPKLLNRFEPWYPLLWTDGSIGAISTGFINELDVASCYQLGDAQAFLAPKNWNPEQSLQGSNGFAIAPSKSKTGHAMLYINPHVTLYFRPEIQINSKEGLQVYGAVTWGQFFVYQGFNAYGGWMHTSSKVDVADVYHETMRWNQGQPQYLLDGQWRNLRSQWIEIKVKGEAQARKFKAYYTHRGPIMGKRGEHWLSVRSFNRSMRSLQQSWQRMLSTGLNSFQKTMDLRANTSNNTVYADKYGNIAYWHGNFVPKRRPDLDWGLSQDGRYSKNDWQGLHALKDIVQSINPKNGWLQNCNSSPFTVAGALYSPKKSAYPVYMAPDGENFRGINAVERLSRSGNLDLDGLIALGYDPHLSAFDVYFPRLLDKLMQSKAYAENHHWAEPLKEIRDWDKKVSLENPILALTLTWLQALAPQMDRTRQFGGEMDQVLNAQAWVQTVSADALAQTFGQAMQSMQQSFGHWRVPFGTVNRFQRLKVDAPESHFSDQAPSVPIPYVSSQWGMLPSYVSKPYPGTKLWYGSGGNSFVCAVDFGPRLQAKSLLAGGQSGQWLSNHYDDQVAAYAQGKFKTVYFYRSDVLKALEKRYRPGEE